MKRLHQTGNIGQDQLELILKKLMEVYRMKGKKEEILVSLSDFEFVVKLPRTKNKLEYEAELGQLIKRPCCGWRMIWSNATAHVCWR